MPPTLEQIDTAAYARDGFLDGGPLLDAAEVGELAAELDRVIAERDRTDRPQPVRIADLGRDDGYQVWQIVDIWRASPAFERTMRAPRLVAAAAALLGCRELRLWHDQIQYKPAGVGGVNPWHQDHPYWGILDRPRQVTAWIAIDDADEANGCMRMVPGSHRWGNRIDELHAIADFDAPPAERDGEEVRAVSRPVPAGHVHFHHPLTWHGSPANRSGRKRRAIAFHYMAEDVRYVAAGDHPMERFVTVTDGESMHDPDFPLVWRAGD